MSIFNPDIIQDESDIIRRKIYEDMIRNINHAAFEIYEKSKYRNANYIMGSTKVIENFDKVFILNSNFV